MSASEQTEGEERQKKRTPWGVMALLLLVGVALVRNGSGQVDVGPPQPASAAGPGTSSTARPTGGPDALSYSVASRVRIPAIQVDAPVVPVGLDTSGWVSAPPPEDPNLAGWFTGGVAPGEKGTAVIVGHVDNQNGPAVFYGLGSLRKGNRIEIRRQDGMTTVFEVYGNQVFSKKNFPGDRVYRSKGAPELRVITCGGGFSQEHGYEGNVVVFARLVDVR
jgi:hypothetical protein